ncbi:hypothetical protein X566_18520 [Afipia sp. P52-10]|uniref:hypothetical protein n=1 Tax=Afipia sp. P52-10 TaxID=1429916 RepID=UPI0003DF45D9|nr:hypothetical protein [Afipia sp. P52-10]ETR75857.1 hypothetical protein X566_18520 [Afipia sp. P52-10]
MKYYSITGNSDGYVVGTGEQDILRIADWKTAAEVVAEASDLMAGVNIRRHPETAPNVKIEKREG